MRAEDAEQRSYSREWKSRNKIYRKHFVIEIKLVSFSFFADARQKLFLNKANSANLIFRLVNRLTIFFYSPKQFADAWNAQNNCN